MKVRREKKVDRTFGTLLVYLIISSILGSSIPIVKAMALPPVLKSPGLGSPPGEIVETLTPTFEWEKVSDADYYALYIRDLEEDKLVFDSEERGIKIIGTSYTLPSGILKWGKPYRWNMRSHGATGWGEYSDQLYFFTGLPGIDVWGGQGVINWKKVSEEVKFAFVRATLGNDHNLVLTLLQDEEGVILDHEDNNIYVDGYHWWYVEFQLPFGNYKGWCAKEGLTTVDALEFKPGVKVKVFSSKLHLRSTPRLMGDENGWNDGFFIRNMENAGKFILVGSYHVGWPNLNLESDALREDAIKEAEHFVKVAGKYLISGYLRPVLDIENDGIKRGTGKDLGEIEIEIGGRTEVKKRLSEWIRTWAEIVSVFRTPIIYTESWIAAGDYLEKDIAEKYPLWISNIGKASPQQGWGIGIWDKWEFWQYKIASAGAIAGISTRVDLDVFNGDIFRLSSIFAGVPEIYAGTSNPGLVYRYLGGKAWQPISTKEELNDDFAVLCLAEYNGRLYAGTMSTSSPYGGIGRVYRYDGGTSWTLVGDNLDNQVCSLAVYAGNLYAGTAWNGMRLYKYTPGSTNCGINDWTRVVDYTSWSGTRALDFIYGLLLMGDIGWDRIGHWDGSDFHPDQTQATGSCIYDFQYYMGKVYASAYRGRMWQSTDGIHWSLVLGFDYYDGNMWELETFKDLLYMAYNNGELRRSHGMTRGYLVYTAPDPIISMETDGSSLYFGTGGEAGASYGSKTDGTANVYRYDGTDDPILISNEDEFGGGVQVLYIPTVTIKCYNKDPVDLIVTDPDGLTISKEVNEIPGATYIEVDLNGDGDLDDQITIPYRKIGDYLITVVPEPDASPDDIYTLEITINGQTIVLAEDVPISDIPDQPYLIQSTETEVNAAPIADADGPYTGFVDLPITFDATNSYDPDGEIVSYEWDLDDDGEFDDAFGPNPTKTWDIPYQGNVSLRVTDDKGATSIDTTTVTVMETIKTVGEPKYGLNDKWVTSKTRFNLIIIPTYTYVNKTYYRVWYKGGWTPWMEYNGNFTLKGEGKHYLEYYSVDNAGNQEEIHNQTHYVDDTPPVTCISVEYGDGIVWVFDPETGRMKPHREVRSVTLTADDNGGVGHCIVYWATRDPFGHLIWYSQPDSVTFKGDIVKNVVMFYSVDALGNREEPRRADRTIPIF